MAIYRHRFEPDGLWLTEWCCGTEAGVKLLATFEADVPSDDLKKYGCCTHFEARFTGGSSRFDRFSADELREIANHLDDLGRLAAKAEEG